MSRGVIFDNNSGPVTVINEKQEARSTILGKLIEIIASAECQNPGQRAIVSNILG